MTLSISAIVLADNYQDIIEDCFKSLDWVMDKILIDLGCQDKTLKLASKHGFRVVKGEKEGDFSLWRNQAAKVSRGNWLFYVDADERISIRLQKEIRGCLSKTSDSQPSGFLLPRKNFFWGKEFRSTWPDYQLRLIKKKALVKWVGKIHETPQVKGKINKLKNPLIHLSHRSLDHCLKNTLKWSWWEAENRLKAKHPKMTSLRFLRIIITGFYDQFIKKKIWKEGTEGIIEGIYQVFSLFITYVRLWEMQGREK